MLSHWPCKSVACHKIQKKTSACIKSCKDWVALLHGLLLLEHHGVPQSTMEQPGRCSSSVLLLLNAEHKFVKPKGFDQNWVVKQQTWDGPYPWGMLNKQQKNAWLVPRGAADGTTCSDQLDFTHLVHTCTQPFLAKATLSQVPPQADSFATLLSSLCLCHTCAMSLALLDALVKLKSPWPGGQTLPQHFEHFYKQLLSFPISQAVTWFNSSAAAQEQSGQLEQAGNIVGDVFTFPSTVSAASTVDKSSETALLN